MKIEDVFDFPKKLEALNAGKLETLKQCILENKMEIEQEMLI